jgi:hypothetical protein
VERNRYVPNFAYFAWLAAVAAAVVALAALGFARAADAQPLPPSGSALLAGPADFEEDDEGEDESESGDDGEEEADDCEFDDEAREEACEEAEEEKEVEEAEVEECRLESAEATVAAVPGRNQLRLTVRYKTFEPSAVAIDLQLRGAKGSLDLGTDTAHFGRSGTLHTTQTLSAPQMARALGAKEFTVGMHAVNTPGFCSDSFERHLTARKGTGPILQWSDPAAARRAKASRA